MILSSRIYVRGNRIDYSYDTVADKHRVWIAGDANGVESSIPGVVVNALIPFRDKSKEVKELISWLMR